MSRLTALASVFSLFALGVLVGGLAVHLYHAKDDAGPDRRGRRHADFFIKRLEQELDLTAEQRERIDAIMQRAHEEGDALHRELVPRVHEHMEKTRLEIRGVLTPEQQKKFDELQERFRGRAERFFLGSGHGRRGPPPWRERPGGGPSPPSE